MTILKTCKLQYVVVNRDETFIGKENFGRKGNLFLVKKIQCLSGFTIKKN